MCRMLVLAAALACAVPAAAAAQGLNKSVQGFGGLTFDTSAIGRTSTAPSVGGVVTARLTPNIQIVGEGGRMSDIKAPLLDLLDFAPVTVRVSAWYAQGGVRFIPFPALIVRPYTEATAGIAHLQTGLSGFSGPTAGIVESALGFTDRTDPLLGLGGGVELGRGPLVVDAGYRYKRIVASGLASALNAGDAYQVNEARIGVGIRF